MLQNIRILIHIMNIGFITAWFGMFIGALLSFVTNKKGRRFQGTILGFTAGLMIAVVCFDLLPEAFAIGNLYIGVLGISAGLLISAVIDGRLEHSNNFINKNQKQRFLKTAFLIAIGVAIHNVPEGIALGSLLYLSHAKGIHLAIILALHCIPEGLAIAIPLKESGAKFTKLLFFSVITAIPMGIGAFIGGLISEISSYVISISLGFAGGLMLYITCGEVLPEAKETWKGRLTTIGSIVGLIVGILVTSLLE